MDDKNYISYIKGKLNIKKLDKRFISFLCLVLFLCILLTVCEYSKYLMINKETAVIKKNKKIDISVVQNNEQGTYYLSFDDAYKYLNGKIFYDNISKKIVITQNGVSKHRVNEKVKTVNYEKTENANYVYSYFTKENNEEKIYVAFDELCVCDNLRKIVDTKYNKIFLVDSLLSIETKTTKNRIEIKDENNNTIGFIEKKQTVNIEEISENKHSFLVSYNMNEKTVVGYIDVNSVELSIVDYLKQVGSKDVEENKDTEDKKIYMVIDNVSEMKSTNYMYVIDGITMSSNENSINLMQEKDKIKDFTDKDFSIGFKLSNSYLDLNYDPDLLYNIVASDSKKEKTAINIKNTLVDYGVKKLIIDYRNIRDKDSKYATEYICELCSYLKLYDITTDIYITETNKIDLTRLDKLIDKYIVVAYGKRNISSNSEGEHSNVTYANKQITSVINNGISVESIILEIPTYSILWTTKQGKITEAKYYSNSAAESYVRNNKLTKVLDKNVNQNYVEMKKGLITYKMWLEDDEEINKKIQLAKDLKIYGISVYKFIYINDTIENMIKK